MSITLRKFVVTVLAGSMLWAFGTAQAEEIKVGGGGASMAAIFNPVKPAFEKATGITLINLQSSPKDGLVDLWNGKLDAAVSAVPLDSMIAGATKDGVSVDKAGLQVQVVGKNKTIVLVHPSNKVSSLTKAQIKGIFTGKIGNWKEVGGDDKEIIVVWGKSTPGQNAQLTKEMLDGEPVVKEVLETTNYVKVRETVAATPEGIGIDPFAIADASVKVVTTEPPMTGDIILVSKGKPSAAVQKLVDYVKGDGAKFTKQ
jgi:phosphate transport system substrate-binding protein